MFLGREYKQKKKIEIKNNETELSNVKSLRLYFTYYSSSCPINDNKKKNQIKINLFRQKLTSLSMSQIILEI